MINASSGSNNASDRGGVAIGGGSGTTAGGGSVIFLTTNSPSSSVGKSSTTLQISPMSSPILHQLAAASPYVEDIKHSGNPASVAAVVSEPLELRLDGDLDFR